MARQLTYPTAWKPMVDPLHEPNRIPDDGDNPMRGFLIGLAMCGRALGGARRWGLVRAASVGVGIGVVLIADGTLDGARQGQGVILRAREPRELAPEKRIAGARLSVSTRSRRSC